jgi:uncharacterized protein (TIGR02118 family)
VVKLFAVLKRRPGMSPEEFHAYWRDVHGPLVARTRSGQHALRYEQHHRPLDDYARTGGPDYDGVTVQWYASREDFDASVREPDYAEIGADLVNFLDLSALVWTVTDEPELVEFGGRSDAASGTVPA